MIPVKILNSYVTRFPHLRSLAERAGDDIRAERTFAQISCRLEAPRDVTAREVWSLAGVANGGTWA